MNRILSVLLLICVAGLPLAAQQSLSVGLSYSHEPQWGSLLPLAGFDHGMSNKSIGIRYQRTIARLNAEMEWQYTLSGYGYEARLAFGRTPNAEDQALLDNIYSGLWPNHSVQHQVAALLLKEWPQKDDGWLFIGAGIGPLLRLGIDRRSWTYDHGTWVEGYFDTRIGVDMGLAGKVQFRFAINERWSLLLAGQWDQYLLISKESNLLSEVLVSNRTGHLGVFCSYHF
ncbi:MAG: hypothetical protein AAF927_03570 [Bacteroidota bacterium]